MAVTDITTPGVRAIQGSIIETEAGQVTSHRDDATVDVLDATQVQQWRDRITDGDNSNLPMRGDVVDFGGTNWVSKVDFNVWTPTEYPNGWRLDVVIPEGQWTADVAYTVGDEVTHLGSTYRCLQSHTSQEAWTPDAVPALWQAI